MRRMVWAICAVALLIVPVAGAAVTPTELIGTPLDESVGAVSEDYLAWNQNSKTSPNRVNAYVRPGGESAYKLNAPKTEGNVGGIDGTRLVFQQYVETDDRSDLVLFDLATQARLEVPAGVNTKHWEYWPTISGDWLLFGRVYRSGERRLILFDSATGDSEVLASVSGDSWMMTPGQVNGGFAVWDETRYDRAGAPISCEVFVHNLGTGATSRVPNPKQKCQWGASVSSDGTVYHGRSGFGCGLSARLMSYPRGGPATTIATFPAGTDMASSYALDRANGATSVIYDSGECGKDTDIFEARIPA